MSLTPPQTEEKSIDGFLHVTILAPEKVMFDGKAKSLTCINVEGPFDILPFHTNFISLIFQEVLVIHPDGNVEKFPIGSSLLKQTSNEIVILTNVKLNEYDEVIENRVKTQASS